MALRNDPARLGTIILLGLLIRVGVAVFSPAVSRDTCQFVWYARDLQQSALGALRDHDQHPLYPALIAAAHAVTGRLWTADPVLGWQLAAQTVSVLAGVLLAPILYGLGWHLYGRPSAMLAALLAVLLPEAVQYSADGLSDLPHAALYLLSLLCGVTALRSGPAWLWAACGLSGGLAFLVRPEGMEPALVITVLAVASAGRIGWKRASARAMVVLVAATIVAAPYMVITGELVRKKSIFRLFDLEGDIGSALRPPDGEAPTSMELVAVQPPAALRAVGVVLWHFLRASRVIYLLLALPAWFGARRPRADPFARRAIILAWLLHFAVLVTLVVNFDYWNALSKRHTLLLVLLIVPAAAAGARRIIDRLSLRSTRPHAERTAATLLILAIVAATGYWMLRPVNAGADYLVRAGLWVRSYGHEPSNLLAPHEPLLTADSRIPFYADMPMQNWPERTGDVGVLADHIRVFRPALVAIDDYRVLRANPGFLSEFDDRLVRTGVLELLHEEVPSDHEPPTRLRIYRVRSPPDPDRGS